MSTNLYAAANQYATRPADERFESLAALIANADAQKSHSLEKKINAKDLTAVAGEGGAVMLQGPKGNPAHLTHWSFGQLSRSIGAPASYLRQLPPELAARCVNHGLQHTPPASDFNLLIQAPNGTPVPTVRACTSETYGRVWDVDLYAQVARQVCGHDDRWQLPPTWDGPRAGAYRGDRDSFLILVNGGSIVSDPTLMNRGLTRRPAQQPLTTAGSLVSEPTLDNPEGMYRGILVKNSEVGASSITIQQILFRYICGNHIIWGAVIDQTYNRRHVGEKAIRDTVREISNIAYRLTTRAESRDQEIIKTLVDREIAQTKEGVIDELRKIGFTKEAAEAAYSTCEQSEYASPRSPWGIAQGATRASQLSGYQDQRFDLDLMAAKVLQKYSKVLVAA